MEETTTHSATSSEAKEETIKISKNTLWKAGTFVFAVLFVISLFTGGFGLGKETVTGQVINDPTVNPEPSQVKVSIDNDAIFGDKDAPVTIVEFSDYQCPFCGRFWSETLPQIKTNYIDTGKVRLVFRDFPLTSIHPLAQPASEAAECVRDAAKGSADAYYKYHDKLFENQASLSDANLKAWAKAMGYNIDTCLSSGKFTEEVNKDSADAQAAGGRGTPFFVVGETPISGAQPYEVFKAAIEAELAK